MTIKYRTHNLYYFLHIISSFKNGSFVFEAEFNVTQPPLACNERIKNFARQQKS